MIKTIFIVHDWQGVTPETRSAVMAQIDAWETEGVYSGESTDNTVLDPETYTKIRTVERWTWVSTEAAQNYINFIESTIGAEYPDIQTSIVIE